MKQIKIINYSCLAFRNKERKMKVLSLLFLVLLGTLSYASDVVVLTDDNFEHLTQASTGSTTGDWFIEMYFFFMVQKFKNQVNLTNFKIIITIVMLHGVVIAKI